MRHRSSSGSIDLAMTKDYIIPQMDAKRAKYIKAPFSNKTSDMRTENCISPLFLLKKKQPKPRTKYCQTSMTDTGRCPLINLRIFQNYSHSACVYPTVFDGRESCTKKEGLIPALRQFLLAIIVIHSSFLPFFVSS